MTDKAFPNKIADKFGKLQRDRSIFKGTHIGWICDYHNEWGEGAFACPVCLEDVTMIPMMDGKYICYPKNEDGPISPEDLNGLVVKPENCGDTYFNIPTADGVKTIRWFLGENN